MSRPQGVVGSLPRRLVAWCAYPGAVLPGPGGHGLTAHGNTRSAQVAPTPSHCSGGLRSRQCHEVAGMTVQKASVVA